MELVCENGQILAKSPKPNNISFQNQRTQSLLDLYKIEYDEGFKKIIKNLGDTQVVPVSESQRHQDEENYEQTNNINTKKRKIKSFETEFERDVSKSNKLVESSINMDGSFKVSKNVGVITAPPDEQSAAVGRSTELYFASSKLSRGTSRDQRSCSLKRKYGDIEEEESTTYLSNVRENN